MSAVSTNSKPTARKPSRILKEIDSSAVQPNTLPPKHNGRTSIPKFPSLRFSAISLPPDTNRISAPERRCMFRRLKSRQSSIYSNRIRVEQRAELGAKQRENQRFRDLQS